MVPLPCGHAGVLRVLCEEAVALSAGACGRPAGAEEKAHGGDAGRCPVSAAPLILPLVYASAAQVIWAGGSNEPGRDGGVAEGTAFYRKYTEQQLRRYMRTSMEMGRTPSVLGNLMFRGKASHTGIRNFEDAVIFVHDVESCLKRIDNEGRDLVARIALQEYSQAEVAEAMGASVRTVMRRYAETLDRLTEILLEVELLQIQRY
jgi:hypothetical protein